jgi:hypothetical protein
MFVLSWTRSLELLRFIILGVFNLHSLPFDVNASRSNIAAFKQYLFEVKLLKMIYDGL